MRHSPFHSELSDNIGGEEKSLLGKFEVVMQLVFIVFINMSMLQHFQKLPI